MLRIELKVTVSLRQVFLKEKVSLEYKRAVFDFQALKTVQKEESFAYELGPAVLMENFVVFKAMGNQDAKTSGDLVVEFLLEKDLSFSFQKLDLIKKERISLLESLTSETLSFENIDGEKLRVSIDQPISPKSVIKVEGKGFSFED